jgi:hypothetical protein
MINGRLCMDAGWLPDRLSWTHISTTGAAAGVILYIIKTFSIMSSIFRFYNLV